MASEVEHDAVEFNQPVKHGGFHFLPGVVYGFEDPDAAPYFKACGWADDSNGDAVVIITKEELDVDPLTIWGDGDNKGKFVMPERAAEALGKDVEWAKSYVATGIPLEQLIQEGNSNG